jgi:hypothetical protein
MSSVKIPISKRRIRIVLGAKILEAELLSNTTAEVIREVLPLKARGGLGRVRL